MELPRLFRTGWAAAHTLRMESRFEAEASLDKRERPVGFCLGQRELPVQVLSRVAQVFLDALLQTQSVVQDNNS